MIRGEGEGGDGDTQNKLTGASCAHLSRPKTQSLRSRRSPLSRKASSTMSLMTSTQRVFADVVDFLGFGEEVLHVDGRRGLIWPALWPLTCTPPNRGSVPRTSTIVTASVARREGNTFQTLVQNLSRR